MFSWFQTAGSVIAEKKKIIKKNLLGPGTSGGVTASFCPGIFWVTLIWRNLVPGLCEPLARAEPPQHGKQGQILES